MSGVKESFKITLEKLEVPLLSLLTLKATFPLPLREKCGNYYLLASLQRKTSP